MSGASKGAPSGAPDFRPDLSKTRPWTCQCGNSYPEENELRAHQDGARHLPALVNPDKCLHARLHPGRIDGSHTVCLDCERQVSIQRTVYADGTGPEVQFARMLAKLEKAQPILQTTDDNGEMLAKGRAVPVDSEPKHDDLCDHENGRCSL